MAFVAIFVFINMLLNRLLMTKSKLHETIFLFTLVNLMIGTAENMLFEGQIILQIFVWALIGIGANQNVKNKEIVEK